MKRLFSIIIAALMLLGVTAVMGMPATVDAAPTDTKDGVMLYGYSAVEMFGGGSADYSRTWCAFSPDNPGEVVDLGGLTTVDGQEGYVGVEEYVDGMVYGYTGFSILPMQFFYISAADIASGNPGAITYTDVALENFYEPMDMAYDYSTDTMYLLLYDMREEATELMWLATVDLATGAYTLECPLSYQGSTYIEAFSNTLAIGNDGTIYSIIPAMGAGMNENGSTFVTVDRETGVMNKVDDLGVFSFQQQSMTFSQAEGIIYWAQFNSIYGGECFLYAIDPATAGVTQLGTIGGNSGREILGLYIAYNGETPDLPDPTPTPEPTPEPPAPEGLVQGFYFEEDPLAEGWQFVDADGDGNNWTWNSDGFLYTYEGLGMIYSLSFVNYEGAITPDNWAVSPAVQLPDADDCRLTVYITAQDSNYAQETFAIYAGTSPDIDTMTMVHEPTVTNPEYTMYEADLSAFAGQTVYVAVRHFDSTDMFAINVDQLELWGTVPEPTPEPTSEPVDPTPTPEPEPQPPVTGAASLVGVGIAALVTGAGIVCFGRKKR